MEQDDFFSEETYKKAREFEKQMESGESFFYDTDELEEIIEFYIETQELNKAWAAISYGMSLYPYENYYFIKQAEVLLNKKESRQAIKLLEECQLREPNNVEISKLLGDGYNLLMQYKRAIDHYLIAFKARFEVDEVLLQLLRLNFILNRPEKAVSFLIASPENPYIADTIIPEVVKLLIDFQQIEHAIPYLRTVIDDFPYNYTAWYFMGYCFQKMEEYENGIDAFEYCIAIDEHNSMGHLGKGNCLMELAKHEEAIEEYNLALDNDSTDAEVYCNIAECYEHLNNLNTAKYFYLKALKIDKNLSDAYYGLGLIYKRQERYREAEKNILKAIDQDPYECLYHIELAELYLLMDKKERCFHHYDKAIEIDGKTIEILLDYAQALVHFEETQHAVTLLLKAIKDGLADYRFFYRASSYLFHIGEYESAYNYLHEALQLSPNNYMLLYEYAPFTENNETVTNIIDLYLLK
ncbi:MAG: tetratricopeptide repeat protein [Bacteroidia bacterium]